MAPAYAMARMLQREGLSLQDFDFYEIHEAFASQVLSTLKAWEDPVFCKERLGLDAPLGSIDRDKLNVKGSSLAAGHPFAATGGRIIPVLAKLLAQSEGGTRSRRHLDLRRRRPGRRRHPRARLIHADLSRSRDRSPSRTRPVPERDRSACLRARRGASQSCNWRVTHGVP